MDHAVASKENMGKMKVEKNTDDIFKFEIVTDSLIRRHMTETKARVERGKRAQQRRRPEEVQQRSRRNWILSKCEKFKQHQYYFLMCQSHCAGERSHLCHKIRVE